MRCGPGALAQFGGEVNDPRAREVSDPCSREVREALHYKPQGETDQAGMFIISDLFFLFQWLFLHKFFKRKVHYLMKSDVG